MFVPATALYVKLLVTGSDSAGIITVTDPVDEKGIFVVARVIALVMFCPSNSHLIRSDENPVGVGDAAEIKGSLREIDVLNLRLEHRAVRGAGNCPWTGEDRLGTHRFVHNQHAENYQEKYRRESFHRKFQSVNRQIKAGQPSA